MKPKKLLRPRSLKDKIFGSLRSGSSYSQVDVEELGSEKHSKNPLFDISAGDLETDLIHTRSSRKDKGFSSFGGDTIKKKISSRVSRNVVENSSLKLKRMSQNVSHYSIHSEKSDRLSKQFPPSLKSTSARTFPSLKFSNSRDDFMQNDIADESFFNKEVHDTNPDGIMTSEMRRQLTTSKNINSYDMADDDDVQSESKSCLQVLISCFGKKKQSS